MHGYLALAVIGPASVAGYTARMGYPPAFGPALAWYLILAHSIGGLLLILGLWTRWAAVAQLPITLPITMARRAPRRSPAS